MFLESLEDGDVEDRAYDRKWVRLNFPSFSLLARDGFQRFGRGAVFVNLAELILRKHTEEGHPFNYRAMDNDRMGEDPFFEQVGGFHSLRYMMNYVPESEFVLVLVKHNRYSIYRLPLLSQEEGQLEIEGPYVLAEAEERRARLTCTDFFAREYSLTTAHNAEWLYRVAGPLNR